MRKRWLVIAVVVFAGCGGDDGADGGATLACTDFRDMAGDYRDGVLTASELRDRIAGFEDEAEVSGEPGVASAARDLLAAATAGDESAMADAVTRMNRACIDAGV